ncbi:MAG TPA: hypothetical protein VFZ21_11265 [Gemmatimonadaceae bacterium]|nr:hypothetical protein [Gemmatimonadaceae bacterium]
MEVRDSRRILIVAHKSIGTPDLLDAIRRRTDEGPCTLTLLIPDSSDCVATNWTLRYARRMLSRSVGTPIEAISADGDDAFTGIMDAVRDGDYDEILISLLPDGRSQWLREDLPRRAEALGVPVTVVQPERAHV